MSKYIGSRCVVCNEVITEANDAHWLEEIMGYETYHRLETYKKPLCTDCKNLMLYANIIEVI